MAPENPLKRPPRAPNKSGYKPKAPTSVKGRKIVAHTLGPWAMLLAMRRVQNGEPSARVCAQFGISTDTMARWQARWAGDVVHMRGHVEYDMLMQAVAVVARMRVQMRRRLAQLSRLTDGESASTIVKDLVADLDEQFDTIALAIDDITGGEKGFAQKRDAARRLRASRIQMLWEANGDLPMPPAVKRAQARHKKP